MGRKKSVTNRLIIFMILIFLLQILTDTFHETNPYIPSLTQEFSFTPSLAFEKPWTFITSIFLHSWWRQIGSTKVLDISHILFNMFALFIFGNFLEKKVDTFTYLTIFFLSGIAGNFGYMITSFDPNVPGVGASGAIYGIIGTLAILEPGAIVFVGYYPVPLLFAAILWGVQEFFGMFFPGRIARGAHFFGLLIGVLIGWKLRSRRRRF